MSPAPPIQSKPCAAPRILPRYDSLDRLQVATTNAYTKSGIPARYWEPQISPPESHMMSPPTGMSDTTPPTQQSPMQTMKPTQHTQSTQHRRQRSIGSVHLPSENIRNTIAARWARINQISNNYEKHTILPKYQRFI
jgi:hypothetical protein